MHTSNISTSTSTSTSRVQILPLTVTKIGKFSTCPLAFKYQNIDKIKVPFVQNIHLKKGQYAHKIIENGYDFGTKFKECENDEIFTLEDKKEIALKLRAFQMSELGQYYLNKDLAGELMKEIKFGLSKVGDTVKVCSYWGKEFVNTPDMHWFRGAIDAYFIEGNVAYSIDWKTGKDKSSDASFGIEQSMLYAIWLFLSNPQIKTVKSRFVFVEHITYKDIDYQLSELSTYIKYFTLAENKILNSEYTANVSGLCPYCEYKDICTSYIPKN